MCYNAEDKPAVREIAQRLSEENVRSWLGEAEIRSGSFCQLATGRHIQTIKSAAVFVSQSDIGPWRSREIIALLDQFERRGCLVIPVILASDAPKPVVLHWSLEGLHHVDFRMDSQSLKRLFWGIIKPPGLSDVPSLEKPATMREAAKSHLRPSRDEHPAAHKMLVGAAEISRRGLYPPAAEPPDQEQASQVAILRGKVAECWVEGVLKHSLYSKALISLSKRYIDRAIDAPLKHTVRHSCSSNFESKRDRIRQVQFALIHGRGTRNFRVWI
jgi:hypothetical protein